MFSKILIANRGEIACRIIRTARRMGIATVAVYSEADAGALHVEMADEGVPIGPAPAAQSYLAIERVVEAARGTGAEAVHPGFGFLAENPAFARALERAGIAFIGPGAKAVEAMGDKIQSKRLAAAAGVNSVPGSPDAVDGPEQALRVAREIGLPVMLKASAGGGGKGMRIARSEDEVRDGFAAAASEARSSFGDDRIFVEKFIEQPRHIEIQVLADSHGHCVHLGERECSIQRRHQKVIEESPSPLIDAETRAAMGAQAVALAKAVDYRSAGTVEFIVDPNKRFYFLEMNTRLQVEHPVTEMVTGLDLVEQMIRIAAGERLGFGQDEVRLQGWAIEARVYAEDPERGFLPSIGRLVRCQAPQEGADVRVDTGVVEGSEITLHYDPMIAKVVTRGADRAAAAAAMLDALDSYYVRGISHNIGFLTAVIGHPRFAEGRLSTGFIDEEFAGGFTGATLTGPSRDALLTAALLVHRRVLAREAAIEGVLGGRRPAFPREWVVGLGEERIEATLQERADGRLLVGEAGRTVSIESDWRPGQPLLRAVVDGRSVVVQVDRRLDGYRLSHGGVARAVSVRRPRAAALAALMPLKPKPDLSRFLLCPMPGLVLTIHVAEGEEVKAGQPLAVIEAMKMENVLRAERDGVVAAVCAAPGDSLSVDEVILEFAVDAAEAPAAEARSG